MNRPPGFRWYALAVVVSVLGSHWATADEASEPAAAAKSPSGVSVDIARDRAKVLHQVYATTLDVMHERYFHDDRAIVPARALEDVFDEVARQSQVQARWISVNTKPMSIGHEPKSDFEKQAAAKIAAGSEFYELVEKDYYRRAAPIRLTDGCVSCHTGFFAGPPKSPRFAALVIGVPLASDRAANTEDTKE